MMNHLYLPKFFSTRTANKLLKLAEAQEYHQGRVQIHGKSLLEPRLTAWFGDSAYTYSGKQMKPEPFPKPFEELTAQLEIATFEHAELPTEYNSLLINYYRDGTDYVSWHADDEAELGKNPIIASVSLGASRDFLIKPKANPTERIRVTLNHGDVFLMFGDFQDQYLHAIPPRPLVKEARYNLTFRRILPCTSTTSRHRSKSSKA